MWALTKHKQVKEIRDDEDPQLTLLRFRMRPGGQAWAETEKAASVGYSPEDV